ncbi:Niemann-Pick type C-2b [Choristoneura fumiferana]|uniref:Niemann-Pick type C-2b n=1 Tax=Choristoneura fumiferana TaxID=7141 RepID=UPI003D15E301
MFPLSVVVCSLLAVAAATDVQQCRGIAEKDIKELKNHVTADVFGVPLPFIGVDGGSVCDKLQTEAGEKAACPLTAGTTYVYKDSFPVLELYPSIEVKVHWALQDLGKDITCFEVPARIK